MKKKLLIVITGLMLFGLLPVEAQDTPSIVRIEDKVITEREFTSNYIYHRNGDEGTMSVQNSNFLINNIHVETKPDKNGGSIAVWAKDNSNVIIKKGEFKNETNGLTENSDLIFASDNSTITIEGGVFKAAIPERTLNCKDNSNSKIIVKGGVFYIKPSRKLISL